MHYILYRTEDLDGIIGGGCSTVCVPVSLLAAAWGIPVISYGCLLSTLGDKDTYPTFARYALVSINI